MRFRQRCRTARRFPLFERGRTFGKPEPPPLPVIRGNMRQAVVVPAPDTLFTEAVFILKDSALRDSPISSAELLQQAKAAAEGYTARHLPERRRASLPTAAFFIGGAAAAVLLLWATGLL